LDERENECLDEETRIAKIAVDAQSVNADRSGNFSVQVIIMALSNSHGLKLENSTQIQDFGNASQDYVGFILNFDGHWFAIRKVGNRYWMAT
jgi:hypothetical protein